MAIAEPEKAIEWNLKALEIAENSKDEKTGRWKVILYNGIGWNYFDQKSYQESLFMFPKALEFYEQLVDPLKIRTAKWGVAKVLRAISPTEPALHFQPGTFDENPGR